MVTVARELAPRRYYKRPSYHVYKNRFRSALAPGCASIDGLSYFVYPESLGYNQLIVLLSLPYFSPDRRNNPISSHHTRENVYPWRVFASYFFTAIKTVRPSLVHRLLCSLLIAIPWLWSPDHLMSASCPDSLARTKESPLFRITNCLHLLFKFGGQVENDGWSTCGKMLVSSMYGFPAYGFPAW